MATYASNLDGKANIGASGSGSVIVEDEGGVVTGGPFTTLDFVGAGVVATNGGSGTATITISGGGGGGGTDTYTAPNEYYVDPDLSVDATKRQYQTITAALTAAGSSTSQVVLRLVEGVDHLWDGSGLDPTVSLTLYSVGTATLQFDETTTIDTDGSVLFRHLSLQSRGVSASGTFTVTTAPLAFGDSFDIGLSFTGVVGARTPGSLDWDVSLGTVELIAAEIAAAINDPANGGSGVELGHAITAVASGAVVTLTVDIPGTIGNSVSISASTTPAGGITVVGISGGTDTDLNIQVSTLQVEGCTGNLVFGMLDGPTPVYKHVRISQSDLELSVVAVGDTIGGSFEIVGSIIRVAEEGLGGLWYHDLATSTWNIIARKTLFNVRPVDPDPIITANGTLLNTAFQDVTMVLYNNTSPMVIQSGGEAGPTWETSRILEGGIHNSVGGFSFGDVGYQFGLVIEHQQNNGLFPLDAPDGTVARSQTEDGGFSRGMGPVTFSNTLLQWRGANNSVMLGGTTIELNSTPEWLTTVTENSPFVNITRSNPGVYSVGGRVFADTADSGESVVWDIDAVLNTNVSVNSIDILSGSIPTVVYETTVGQFTLNFTPAGNVAVNSAPIVPGTTLVINGITLTAIAGARTPGSDDFDGSLGTGALIAADIAAAINDASNSFVGVAVAQQVGDVITIASMTTNVTLVTGSGLDLPGLGFSLIATRNTGSGTTLLSADARIRSSRIYT